MFRARWRTFIRPPLIPPIAVMGTAALISFAAAQLAVAAPLFAASAATDCTTPGAAARAMSRSIGSPPVVTDRIDGSGSYAGRAVTIAARSTALTLPAESFVGEPSGDALIYTTSVSGKSEAHLLDLATGCDALIAKPMGTVRSALLSPDGAAIYAHSVTYPNRLDTGVTRYALDGSAPQQVVPSAPEDSSFGPTFGTQLGWATDGAGLFVQSCGIDSCRTRILDVASGAIAMFAFDGQGPVIGSTSRHLVTLGACDGLPCPVLSVDRTSGAITTVANEAWSASLAGTTLSVSTATGTLEIQQ